MSASSASTPTLQHGVVQRRYGRADDVLEWSDRLPLLPPVGRQVQLRVHAASVNPIDWQMIEGNRRLIARRRFPFVPLFDLAGVVTAVGPEVRSFHVGDLVHADNQRDGGGASEFVNVEEGLVGRVPDGIGMAEAAAIPLAAQTALSCLDRGKVTRGSRVAVIGASGGVGTFVVQMARALGAGVVGVSSAHNHALVRSLGATGVVDRRAETLDTAFPRGSFDVVVDCVGGREHWEQAKRVLEPRGRFVTISRDEDGVVTVPSALRLVSTITARRLRARLGSAPEYEAVFLDASSALLGRVDAMVAAGQVAAHIGATFPFSFDGVVGALRASRDGRSIGKIVIEMAG